MTLPDEGEHGIANLISGEADVAISRIVRVVFAVIVVPIIIQFGVALIPSVIVNFSGDDFHDRVNPPACVNGLSNHLHHVFGSDAELFAAGTRNGVVGSAVFRLRELDDDRDAILRIVSAPSGWRWSGL